MKSLSVVGNRGDVMSYYASIDHDVLLNQLREQIDDPRLLDLLEQYVRRTVVEDGLYEDVTRGISLGCALSPVMGALYLQRLDERMEATGLFYARFMDDWVVLAPSRWKLRRAVRLVQQTLDELKVQTHPEKTFVGKTERGFSFLGYQINSAGLVGVAPPTVERFVERVNRLYEQGASLRCIGEYVRRWMVWVLSGLREFAFCGVATMHIPPSQLRYK
ncbi:MAG: group II intron reverse transcriptase domain-containing protein [Planctomycetes bacterium]|nr:group II intron reverse transcriptase domain-containing protein [Planctomycetota bacterium]